MGLQRLQERVLSEKAESSHRYIDLLFFCATLGAWKRFHEIGRSLDATAEEDLLAYRLLGIERAPEHAQWVTEHVQESRDTLLHYTLTKFYLGRNDIKGALSVAKALLSRERKETSPLNLIAEYAAHEGENAVAVKIAESSLAINADQRDMSLLRDLAKSGTAHVRPLYLGVAPKLEPLTFYVPAYNVECYIRRTIEALVGQNYPLAEIIVVDDGSSDGTLEAVKEYPVRLIEFGENRGLAAARNAAFNAAVTPFVGSVDADVVADADYATHIMIEYENAAANLSGVGGRLIEEFVDTPGDAWRACHIPQGWYPHRMYFDGFPQDVSGHCDSPYCEVFFLNGCNNVFRRESVLRSGGYNEKYRTNSEDATMCVALRMHGFHLAFTRGAISRHARRDTPESVLRTLWRYGFWGRKEAGYYRDAPTLLNNIHYTVNEANQRLADDIRRGVASSAYLDFLLLFHWALLDIRHAVEEGLLNEEQGAYTQRAAVSAINVLDEMFGGRLLEKVEKDCAALLIDAMPRRESLTPQLLSFVDDYVALLSRELATYPEEVYSVLIKA